MEVGSDFTRNGCFVTKDYTQTSFRNRALTETHYVDLKHCFIVFSYFFFVIVLLSEVRYSLI
jgi:hypothetical protein